MRLDKNIQKIQKQLEKLVYEEMPKKYKDYYISVDIEDLIYQKLQESIDVRNHVKIEVTATTEDIKNNRYTITWIALDELGKQIIENAKEFMRETN